MKRTYCLPAGKTVAGMAEYLVKFLESSQSMICQSTQKKEGVWEIQAAAQEPLKSMFFGVLNLIIKEDKAGTANVMTAIVSPLTVNSSVLPIVYVPQPLLLTAFAHVCSAAEHAKLDKLLDRKIREYLAS